MICVGYSKRASFIKEHSVDSLKEQNDRIRKYARSKGWKISRFYEDKSDDPDSDTAFMNMRSDGMERSFDVVIIDSVYRCGKTVSYARELLLNTFYPAGIHFIILEDNINSFEMSRVELAEYFLYIRQNANTYVALKIRNENLINEGKISRRYISYGYKLNDSESDIEVDEYAANVIKKFFELYSEGKGYKEVSEYFNNAGIEPPSCYLYNNYHVQTTGKSNVWNKSICQNIRRNEKLLGRNLDIGYTTLHYPAIIDKEIFDKVNEMHKGKTYNMTLPKRVENAFNRKIFYCNSDNILICKKTKGDNSYRYFIRKNKKVKFILYADVEKAVKECLLDEKLFCNKLYEYLKENGSQDMIDRIRCEYHDKALHLYDLSYKAIEENIPLFKQYENNEISSEEYREKHDKILQEFRTISDDFTVLLHELADSEKSLSIENKWLKRFMKYDETAELTKSVVNMLVDKIIVNDDKSIDVFLLDRESEIFPEEWRNIDGKKAKSRKESSVI